MTGYTTILTLTPDQYTRTESGDQFNITLPIETIKQLDKTTKYTFFVDADDNLLISVKTN